ncbi:MFS transporter [Roseomonas hellenica]|uniref:MFS transporter n=1 Tax=Plastoroseomonas hellenica TaxID=2687306 RepID=A0ABS5EUN9_9PROT|nr:MFS transporter [Plastoroseomonas hellenica]
MPRPQIIILFVLLVTSVSQSFIYAVLPSNGRALGLSDIQIGAISAFSTIGFIIGAPILGGLSERFGRVPFLAFGMLAGALVNLVFYVAIGAGLSGLMSVFSVYLCLVFSRLFLNVSWSGMFPAVQAYTADKTTDEKRGAVIAMNSAAHGVGAAAGPMVALGLAALSPLAPFLGVALLSFLTFLLVVVFLSDGARASDRGAKATKRGDAGLLWRIWPLLLVGFLSILGTRTLQQMIAFRVQDEFALPYEEAAHMAGIMLAALAVTMIIGQILIGFKIVDRKPLELIRIGGWMACLGSVMYTACGFLSSLPHNALFPLELVCLLILGAGLGFVGPGAAALVTFSAGKESQGRAAGLWNSAQVIGLMTGPILGTALYQVNANLPFVLISAIFAGIFFVARMGLVR